MDAQPNENIFEITVTPEGSERMMRLFKMVKWLFAGAIVLGLAFLLLSSLRYVFYSRITFNRTFLIDLEAVITPVSTVVITVLMIGSMYSYFHFTRLCKRSIQLRQTDLFNYSFKWLLRSCMFSLSLLLVELLMAMFSIYQVIYLLRRMPAS
jgi:hypothetical protein